jgi:hypothetical protein
MSLAGGNGNNGVRRSSHTHGNLKAIAGLAQQVLFGNAAVLENEVAGARGPNAKLPQLKGGGWSRGTGGISRRRFDDKSKRVERSDPFRGAEPEPHNPLYLVLGLAEAQARCRLGDQKGADAL